MVDELIVLMEKRWAEMRVVQMVVLTVEWKVVHKAVMLGLKSIVGMARRKAVPWDARQAVMMVVAKVES